MIERTGQHGGHAGITAGGLRWMVAAVPAFLSAGELAASEPLVRLDAAALPTGPLAQWPNTGRMGGVFSAEFDIPVVNVVAGVRGVTLDGSNDWYVGPAAPASVTGNGARTILAWVHNPSDSVEETVVSWGRRGGPAGTHMAFNHGNHGTWGAVAHWDAPDMSWSGQRELNQWTFLAYSYDPASSLATIYCNGRLVEARAMPALDTHALSTTGQPLAFVVGCENRNDGVRNNSQLPGSLTLGRVEIHDRALRHAEIALLHNQNAAAYGRAAVPVPASIGFFQADRPAVFRGDPVVLRWQAFGQDELRLEPAVEIPAGADSVTVFPERSTTYTLSAVNRLGIASQSLRIHVDPGAPVAADLEIPVEAGQSKAFTLAARDPNPPPAGLVWQVTGGVRHGVLGGTAPDLSYTPNDGFFGTDSLRFTVSDGHGLSREALVTLRVNPPPTAPSAVQTGQVFVTAASRAEDLLAYLESADPNFGETHQYALVSGEGDEYNSLVRIAGNQLLAGPEFAMVAGELLRIRVRSTDSAGLSSESMLVMPVAVAPPAQVVISEIFHDPPQNARTPFIEIHNPGSQAVDLSGWAFTAGITYLFPSGSSLAAGGYAVVAMDAAAFAEEFGFAPMGTFGGRLAGSGERVDLRDAGGNLVDRVEYRAEFPWPVSAGGAGASMELIHPALDNNLGGSWRGSLPRQQNPQSNLVATGESSWQYRAGTTFPAADWRLPSFVPDTTWQTGRAPIGYGQVDNLPLNTQISGMQGSYRSLFVRRNFTVSAGDVPSALRLRYTADDGIIVWINGVQVARRNVSGTSANPSLGTNANTFGAEGLWYEVELANAGTYLVEGVNTISLRLFNQDLNSSDLGFDLELIRPAGESVLRPTPAAVNTVGSTVAPPQIRQVRHVPVQPRASESTMVSAKITDPQGVGEVWLDYQLVAPGDFIPARFPRSMAQILADPEGDRPVNPAFESPANWRSVRMRDDGGDGDPQAADGLFTAIVPAQPHRTLVRYRIRAADVPGTAVRVPYADDPSLNFAWFTYDGVPDYHGPEGEVWPGPLLESVPVHHWLIRPQDMQSLLAYHSWEQFPNDETDAVLAARRAEDWEGALVHDGVVYDHVGVRLRGGNSRYGDFEGRFTQGKRHLKFKFNRGHDFQARDDRGRPYPEKWRSLALSKMFGNKGGNSWGLPEDIGSTLWSSFGVPAPATHWIHFRVIQGADEAPDPYFGDYYGLMQAVEEYDGSFLDARGMTKGNLYKMSDWIWDSERQRRYQSPDMVRDGSEFNNIRDKLHGGQSAGWLRQHVNYDSWYRYSAVAEAIRHYDLFPFTEPLRHSLKNLAWYFEPTGTDPTRGVCVFMPYDWDASFGPNWNNGWEHANNALYGHDMTTSFGMPYLDKPEMKIEHRNILREFRDLVWQPDQVNGLLDARAGRIAALSKADQARWRMAPAAAGRAQDDSIEFKVADMKAFCFTGWRAFGGTGVGPTVGPGGRGAHLDMLADGPDLGLLPDRPVIAYLGAAGHPVSSLRFGSSAFADPQGSHTFSAMAWRIGRVWDPSAPAHDPEADHVLEITPVWESGEVDRFDAEIRIPPDVLSPGHRYRARVRHKDASGRWSHWSAPHEFLAAVPEPAALLHYWNFNQTASFNMPTRSTGGGALLAEAAGAGQVISHSSQDQGFAGLNAREGDPAGAHLRANSPLETRLVFRLPTTGFRDIVVRYETRRSGQGAGVQRIETSMDGGGNWLFFEDCTVADADPALRTLDFRGLVAVEDNPGFAVRISFFQGDGGLAGNNRIDNFTVEGNPLSDEPLLLPGGDAQWNHPANWAHLTVPQGAGEPAWIGPPAMADRNVTLVAPVTVGYVRYDNADSFFRNGLDGFGLTLDGGGSAPARIEVRGTGEGFAEWEITGGVTLATDAVLEVTQQPGHPEHGALRLLERWSGPGGLIKRGRGTASMTGAGKDFLGELRVEQGVLRITEQAVPANASSVRVEEGGQIRLVSASPESGPRMYQFGGDALVLAGAGPAEGLPGALCHAPGGDGHVSVVANPLVISSGAALHTEGVGNRLELAGPLRGHGTLVVTGAGVLKISADSPAWQGTLQATQGPVHLAAQAPAVVLQLGSQASLHGHGALAGLAGEGSLFLAEGDLQAGFSSVSQMAALLRHPWPARNVALFLSAGDPLPAAPERVDLFLSPAQALRPGQRYVGGLLLPAARAATADLGSTEVRILVADPTGEVSYLGQSYRPAGEDEALSWAFAETTADFGGGPRSAITLELLVGGEPQRYEEWRNLHFHRAADRQNEVISGPQGSAAGDGVANLLRYALGVGPYDPVRQRMPVIGPDRSIPMLRLYVPQAGDLAWRVALSEDLVRWSEVLHDSRHDPQPVVDAQGWAALPLPPSAPGRGRFARLEIILP